MMVVTSGWLGGNWSIINNYKISGAGFTDKLDVNVWSVDGETDRRDSLLTNSMQNIGSKCKVTYKPLRTYRRQTETRSRETSPFFFQNTPSGRSSTFKHRQFCIDIDAYFSDPQTNQLSGVNAKTNY